jgi:hypothetical protein
MVARWMGRFSPNLNRQNPISRQSAQRRNPVQTTRKEEEEEEDPQCRLKVEDPCRRVIKLNILLASGREYFPWL